MKDSVGDPTFSIWLIADSEPRSWQGLLLTPLDPRHPARHSIWTSVLDYMQEMLYREQKLRFASDRLYITNAVKKPEHKPTVTAIDWPAGLQEKLVHLGKNSHILGLRSFLLLGPLPLNSCAELVVKRFYFPLVIGAQKDLEKSSRNVLHYMTLCESTSCLCCTLAYQEADS